MVYEGVCMKNSDYFKNRQLFYLKCKRIALNNLKCRKPKLELLNVGLILILLHVTIVASWNFENRGGYYGLTCKHKQYL